MSNIDLETYVLRGDKKNSDFFNEYLPKVYRRRRESGIDQLVGKMLGVVIQVQPEDVGPYLAELTLYGPYRYVASRRGATHDVHFMQSKPEFPRILVIAPREAGWVEELTQVNGLYPNARSKPNARYVGEVYHCADVQEARKTLESQNIRFVYDKETRNPLYYDCGMLWTYMSDYTENRTGYFGGDLDDHDALRIGDAFELPGDVKVMIEKAAETQTQHDITERVIGLDHCATRILSGEREDAILEFLTMIPYYYWGAYDISEMDSSTNVTRNPDVGDDKESPAKVFTANNIPSFVNSFENRPMPTEEFVRNFGRRMHHMAYAVVDGEHAGEKNVDYVVGQLRELGVEFLAHVVGECKDTPNLKQIFSKSSHYSLLITEFIERCHKFEGFFTRDNVAALTEAAGDDERFQHGQVWD